VRCECVFLRLGSRCCRGGGLSGSTPDRIFASSKTATSPCRTGSLHRPLRSRASGLFPALQGSGALLYAARRDPYGVSPVPR
jgi:hypothetical protein